MFISWAFFNLFFRGKTLVLVIIALKIVGLGCQVMKEEGEDQEQVQGEVV